MVEFIFYITVVGSQCGHKISLIQPQFFRHVQWLHLSHSPQFTFSNIGQVKSICIVLVSCYRHNIVQFLFPFSSLVLSHPSSINGVAARYPDAWPIKPQILWTGKSESDASVSIDGWIFSGHLSQYTVFQASINQL